MVCLPSGKDCLSVLIMKVTSTALATILVFNGSSSSLFHKR